MTSLKYLIAVVFFWTISATAFSQLSLPAASGDNIYTFNNFNVGAIFNVHSNDRHSSLFYNNLKINGYQVISLYQSDMGQDRVYYIDKEGNGVNHFFAPTGVSNLWRFDRIHYDSFNPTGAQGMGQALACGMINLLFQKKRISPTLSS